MHALGGGGGGGFWGWGWGWDSLPKKPKHQRKRFDSKSSNSVEATGGPGFRFPLKQALTAGSLALTGDTIAQFRERWRKAKTSDQHSNSNPTSQDITQALLSDHDWLRALRMTSYGFLLYGPGSYAWYQYLDHALPAKTAVNIFLKVLLNQVVLGPSVIAVVFAWNNLWQGKLSQLPEKYRKDALPTLLYGFRFWIPVSLLNFWVVPLQARVAFMCLGSIFWNFCLSSTMSSNTYEHLSTFIQQSELTQSTRTFIKRDSMCIRHFQKQLLNTVGFKFRDDCKILDLISCYSILFSQKECKTVGFPNLSGNCYWSFTSSIFRDLIFPTLTEAYTCKL